MNQHKSGDRECKMMNNQTKASSDAEITQLAK